jgi:hypothetical protein
MPKYACESRCKVNGAGKSALAATMSTNPAFTEIKSEMSARGSLSAVQKEIADLDGRMTILRDLEANIRTTIPKVPKLYVIGENTKKLRLTYKVHHRKSGPAARVFTVDTTVGKLRSMADEIFFWTARMSYAMPSKTPYFYFPGSDCSVTIFHLLKKLGAEIKIPVEFNGDLRAYSKTFYDTLLYSSQKLILDE